MFLLRDSENDLYMGREWGYVLAGKFADKLKLGQVTSLQQNGGCKGGLPVIMLAKLFNVFLYNCLHVWSLFYIIKIRYELEQSTRVVFLTKEIQRDTVAQYAKLISLRCSSYRQIRWKSNQSNY